MGALLDEVGGQLAGGDFETTEATMLMILS
jgi:hypothetical protein